MTLVPPEMPAPDPTPNRAASSVPLALPAVPLPKSITPAEARENAVSMAELVEAPVAAKNPSTPFDGTPAPTAAPLCVWKPNGNTLSVVSRKK